VRSKNVQWKFVQTVLGYIAVGSLLVSCKADVVNHDNSIQGEISEPVSETPIGSPTAQEVPSEVSNPEGPSPTTTVTPGPVSIPTSTSSWVGPDSYPEDVNPLTGLKVQEPEKLERRPVMIKVSNYPASLRPHSGLSYADIVFSYFIGEGMTRYLALFYGQDATQVGPVRSGRLIDSQLVNLYGGFLGMVGADRTVWRDIASSLPGRFLTEMPVNCPALCDNGYGTAFANTDAFTERVRELGLDNQRPDLSGLRFDEGWPEGGQEATRLWLYISYYNQVGWDYQAEDRVYLRSQEVTQSDGTVLLEPMTDRNTGEQLAFDNVVILFAWHNIIQPELIGIELQTVKDGKAILLRDGWMFEITYSAISPNSPLRFYDLDGNQMAFKPGTTWVEIVGLGTTVEELEPGSWKVRFYP
jgi:hypothetical protein